MASYSSSLFTLFVCACVYTEVKCHSTCSNMMECTTYNIQQVGSKVDSIQSNMAAIANQLSQIQVQITTDKEEMQQQMATEIKEIQQQMATDKEEMQQQMATEIEKMQQEIVSQKEEIQDLTLKLESKLSEENCKPEKEELSDFVSFMAYAKAERNYNNHDRVRFDATLRNYGSAYFTDVSEFICPVNAYYMISISLLAANGEKMYGRIMLDDEELVIACARNDAEGAEGAKTFPSSSQTMVTYCESGQKVWVKCTTSNNNRMYGSSRPYSTFSATLLRVM